MGNKGWRHAILGLIIAAGAAVLPTEANAANLTLDWEQIARDGQWQNGQLDGSFGLGQGTVDINFQVGNNINFVGFNGSITPAVNAVVNGSKGEDDRTLHLQIDADRVGLGPGDNAITMTTEFNGFTNPVTDVSFWLYDIDISGGRQWQDRVILKGYSDNEVVNPMFEFLNPNQNSVEIVDTYTLDGIKNVGNDRDNSNVLVSFASPIDSFEMIFTDGDDVTLLNPANHGISIGDISFTAADKVSTPEPSSLVTMGLFALFGGSWLKARNKSSK